MPSIGGPPVLERSSGADFDDSVACPKANTGKQIAARKNDFFIN
jgi:hypothetical protein